LVSEAKFLDGFRGEQLIPGIDYRNKVWNLEQIFTQALPVNSTMPSKILEKNNI
jgi:hypothetical protein